MKKYGSVFALAARASLLQIIVVTLLTAALCGVLLWFVPAQVTYGDYEAGNHAATATVETIFLYRMVKKSFCYLPALLGFCTVGFFLSRIGTGKGVQPGYTVYRLRIPPRSVTVLWIIYNSIMLLFYRAVVTLSVYGAIGCRLQKVGRQALLLASYNSSFLHGLLPLRDTAMGILQVLLLVLLAIGCAMTSAEKWRDNGNPTLPIAFSLSMTAESMSMSLNKGMTILLIAATLIVLGAAIYKFVHREEEYEAHQ